MFGSDVLEIAIGVIFVFLLVSIIASALREALEAWLRTRAAYLERGVRELLHDKEASNPAKTTGLASALFNHPLIYSLYATPYEAGKDTGTPRMFANGRKLPSYIPARNFAIALMDIAATGPADVDSSRADTPQLTSASIRRNVVNLRNPPIEKVLLTALDTAHDDFEQAQANLEAWFNSGMDRVTGWYKRSTQWILFWVGLVLAVALNVNPITIVDYLSHNSEARAVIVAKAQVASTDKAFLTQSAASARAALDSLSLPIGWDNGWGAPHTDSTKGWSDPWNNVLAPIFGWLLTALAATLGAPFWFDLLNKVMMARTSMKPVVKPAEARETPTVDTTTARSPGIAAPQSSETVSTPHAVPTAADGCDVEMSGTAVMATRDEELPAAEGGVG